MFLKEWIASYKQSRKNERLQNKPNRSQAAFKKKYPKYQIGAHTYGTPLVKQSHQNAKLLIGDYCSIADNVKIYLGGIHRADWVSTYPFPAFFSGFEHINDFNLTKGDVIIGSDVWLCANCIILSGVKIGHGAVIGNGAVVTKDVPPYAVVAGNPAKIIKMRFDEATIQVLLKSEWWTWSEDEVKKVIPLLCRPDVDAFKHYLTLKSQ